MPLSNNLKARSRTELIFFKMSWDEYLNKTKKSNPRPLLVEALKYVKKPGKALDLGCGAMNDTIKIFNADFKHVDAIDTNPSISSIADTIVSDGFDLKFYLTSYKDFNFKSNEYDLINAQYSLPFMKPIDFPDVWNGVTKSLLSGGIFTGQFFGTEDAWSTTIDMTFHTKSNVTSLFPEKNWEIILLNEFKGIKKTVRGEDKFWHIFDVIVEKK